MIRAGFALAFLAAVGTTGAGAMVAYRAGPPPAHTGAFGEPDCGECHFDAVRDDTRGSVRIDAPDRYEPGRSYLVTVEVRHPDLPAAGFQLSARFLDGRAKGDQAGTLEPGDARSHVQHEAGVAYAGHTAAGASPLDPDAGVARWKIRWTAPAEGGVVALDVAAQAASDDDSEFGERIYLTRHTTRSIHPGKPSP